MIDILKKSDALCVSFLKTLLEEDNAEAFNVIEDEDILCSNYIPGERTRKLPDAVVIGARKGGTRNFLKAFL